MFTTPGSELVLDSRDDVGFINGTTEYSRLARTTANPENNGSCGEQTKELDITRTVLIGLMLAMITTVTVVGNALVVIAICVVKKLRQPSNYLLVSLAIADLSVALAVMPFAIVTDLTGGVWMFGEMFCNIFIGMDVMCCTASIMTLCVISVDRYMGITRPLTYPARQNGQLMAKMIVGVWLVSASVTLPPFCSWVHNINSGGVCLISQDVGYTLYSTAVAFYIPMGVMLVMYYRIFRAASRSGAKHPLGVLPQQAGIAGTTTDTLPLASVQAPPTAVKCSAYSRQMSREQRNGSIYRREQKAATTLGVIVGVFSFCWLPFFLFTTLRPFICSAYCDCAPAWLERVLLWLGYTNSLMNPLIYGFFNRDLRSTYKDLLRCRYRNISRRLSAVAVHEALKP